MRLSPLRLLVMRRLKRLAQTALAKEKSEKKLHIRFCVTFKHFVCFNDLSVVSEAAC
jgi:hypothetical protein